MWNISTVTLSQAPTFDRYPDWSDWSMFSVSNFIIWLQLPRLPNWPVLGLYFVAHASLHHRTFFRWWPEQSGYDPGGRFGQTWAAYCFRFVARFSGQVPEFCGYITSKNSCSTVTIYVHIVVIRDAFGWLECWVIYKDETLFCAEWSDMIIYIFDAFIHLSGIFYPDVENVRKGNFPIWESNLHTGETSL